MLTMTEYIMNEMKSISSFKVNHDTLISTKDFDTPISSKDPDALISSKDSNTLISPDALISH